MFVLAHSTFIACSRNFSSSALRVTTSLEIKASFAFEPMVLISRFISWARKSRCDRPVHRTWCKSSNCLK